MHCFLINVVIPGTPTRPKSVEVTEVTVDSISITWEGPDNDGGSKVIGYIIEIQGGDDATFEPAAKVDALTLTITLKNLKEDMVYRIQVGNNDVYLGLATSGMG